MTQRRVSVRSFDGFAYSMGSEYVTPSFLRRLFVVDSEEEAGPLALVDVHELDVFAEDEHGCFPVGELNPAAMYQLVPQAVIDVSEGDDDEDDDNKPQTPLQAKYLPREGARKRAIPQERAAAVKRAVLEIVGELYRPAHPRLFVFSEEYLEPAFAAAAKAGDAGYLQRATGTGLYAGKMFTDAFCAMFVEEIESFERSGMPLTRPNSMNNYGIILRDVGLADMVERVLADYLAPLSAKLYPDYEEAQSIDSMHAFIVQYRLSEDRSLEFHYDDAHVTMVITVYISFSFPYFSAWFILFRTCASASSSRAAISTSRACSTTPRRTTSCSSSATRLGTAASILASTGNRLKKFVPYILTNAKRQTRRRVDYRGRALQPDCVGPQRSSLRHVR